MEPNYNILNSLHIILDGKDYTYKEIFANYKSTNFGNPIISLDPIRRYFSLKENNENYLFFLNPITINIKEENNNVETHENIYS